MFRRLTFIAAVLLTMPGCLCMMLGNTQASAEELKPYYFTYAGRDPYADQGQGLVLGRIGAAVRGTIAGTTFHLERQTASGWEPVTLEFESKTSSYHGVIFGRAWHENKVKTREVYCGNAPMGRRDPVPFMDSGGMATSLVMADSDWSRNVTALTTWQEPGWFLVRLPPGHYRITDIAHHTNKTDWKEGYSSTTVESTDWIVNRTDGPEFDVTAAKVRFIGEYAYGSAGDPAVSRDLAQAQAAFRQALSRLDVKGTPFAWEE